MMTYLEDGHCSLSNQMSENAIRPVTVGRRYWLFCYTTNGADASMAVYSLLETARANGLSPLKYLSFLLEARPNTKMSDEELEKLVPWSLQAQERCVNKSEQKACVLEWYDCCSRIIYIGALIISRLR